MDVIELVIKDVPDVESVKQEIILNAMITIKNHLLSAVPKSQEQKDAEAAINQIVEKNKAFAVVEKENFG